MHAKIINNLESAAVIIWAPNIEKQTGMQTFVLKCGSWIRSDRVDKKLRAWKSLRNKPVHISLSKRTHTCRTSH